MKTKKYPAIVYCSVLGEEPLSKKEKMTLRKQELICRNYAKKSNYSVTKVIKGYRNSFNPIGSDFMKFIFSCKKKKKDRYLIVSNSQVLPGFLEFYQNFYDYKNIWIHCCLN